MPVDDSRAWAGSRLQSDLLPMVNDLRTRENCFSAVLADYFCALQQIVDSPSRYYLLAIVNIIAAPRDKSTSIMAVGFQGSGDGLRMDEKHHETRAGKTRTGRRWARFLRVGIATTGSALPRRSLPAIPPVGGTACCRA
ncbi:hypothetical protein [Massilia sp. YMA4]|uniref:hypothetical protein n=1 Tax=Massilia sp. YMA4 TaxID=1593482 RepID=UPI0015813D46|nr:hypothetical protein [Massilia sp. YMA4]